MASGSFSTNFCSSKYQVYVAWQETGIDNDANTSKVKVSVYVKSLGTARISASAEKSTTVTINGKEYSFTHEGLNLSGGGTVLMGSVTSSTIAHNTDGSKSVTITVDQDIRANLSGQFYGVITASKTVTLTQIPRASTISKTAGSSTTIGGTYGITIKPAQSGYTHTITATCGTEQITIAEKTSETSILFGSPISWCSQAPAATYVSCVFECTTYNGDTEMGTYSYVETLFVPDSVVPVINSVTITDPTCGGAYGFLQNYCKAQIDVDYELLYGATIASIVTSINGESLSGTPATTQPLKDAGENTYTVTVTDSRGRYTTYSGSLTVTEYAPPTFNVTIDRCTEDGTAYAGGDHAKVSGSVTVYDPTGSGAKTMTISDGTTTTTVTIGDSGSVEAVVVCDTDSRVTFTITASDGISSSSQTFVIESTVSWMDFGPDGVSVAFGGVLPSGKTGITLMKLPVEFLQNAVINGYYLFYMPGNEWSEAQQDCAGHITGNGKNLAFTIPTVPIMGSVRFKELSLCVRTPDGIYPYIQGDDGCYQLTYTYLQIISGGEIVLDGVEKVSVLRRSGGPYVSVTLKNPLLDSDGGSAITNNTMLNVMANYTAECYKEE